MGASVKLLADKKPLQPNPKVAKALEAVMLQGENVRYRTEAARALKNWSTAESIPGLMKALNDNWPPVRSHAMEAMCKYAPKEAIKPVTQQLINLQTRGSAEKFLRAIGPEAEDAVLAHITHPDPWVRACICGLLESLGTKKCLPALEKAIADENHMVNGNARRALPVVKAREDSPSK
jgi:HEAT repeat protein